MNKTTAKLAAARKSLDARRAAIGEDAYQAGLDVLAELWFSRNLRDPAGWDEDRETERAFAGG